MAAPSLAPGTLLSGRYQLLELIGQSDLSQVYAASDQRGQAQVALKVFEHAVLARSAALSEYQAQARHASGLGVEGIARAYDFGIDANSGLPFSTAERIGWVSLDRRVLAQGPMSIADLGRALAVLARALDAAHAAGLTHRDLKPQNVFISSDNPEWVRITDFGMNAVRRGAPEAMGWGGPPGYTAPEAVDASAAGTPAADLFALAVVAFYALTRSSPFPSLRGAAFDPNLHWAELNQPLGRLSDRARDVGVALEPALDPWFSRALAVRPQDRFPNAGDMASELCAVAERLGPRGPRGTLGIGVPGIAAAIAQPLLFQPDPSSASLGLQPLAAPTSAPAVPSSPSGSRSTPPSGGATEKGAALPLLIGLGVVLLSGVALGGYFLLHSGPPTLPIPSTEPSTTPSGIPALTSAATVTATPPPAPAASSVLPAAPEASTSAPEPEPSRPAAAPVTAATPQEVVPKVAAGAKAVATPKPAPPKPEAAVSEPKATGSKPTPEAKPATSKPKKKCSTFLGCK